MPFAAIVGAQWGDEGKGKITDVLAQGAGLVMRYGGGSNAGHTVINDHGEFRLHLIPAGIFNPNTVNLIGTGTVVDFHELGEEMVRIEESGVATGTLRISDRAQVVMPYHLLLDRLEEEARGARAIGTTRRGVGPAYEDKAARVGIQVCDLLWPQVLERKLSHVLEAKNRLLHDVYGQPPLDLQDLLSQAADWRKRYENLFVDQVELLAGARERNVTVLLEGQLGAMRDLDWGTYPYVTSSTTIAGGGAVGGGVPPMLIDHVVGVVKAYTTAVGAGPLPTEIEGDLAEELRQAGEEFGATTGRPRRVGWFDAVAARYATRLNRFSSIAVTKLDVLDKLPSLKIATAYSYEGTRYRTVPCTPLLEHVAPDYEEMPGWMTSTVDATEWDDLPPEARAYLERIEELVDSPISLISVGPARRQTIMRSTVV